MKNLRKYFTKPMVFRHFYHTILQICYIPIKAPSMVVITIATNTTRHIIARSLCLFLLYTMLTSFLKCMPAAILIRCQLTLIGYPATFIGCPATFVGCPATLTGCPATLTGCPATFTSCPPRLRVSSNYAILYILNIITVWIYIIIFQTIISYERKLI